MGGSLIVTMLAERSTDELETMRSKLETEQTKLATEAGRIELELQQIDEALDRKTRTKGGAKTQRRRTLSGGPSAYKQVRDYIRGQEGKITPAQTKAALRANGFTGSNSAVYNSFRRLLEAGFIEKIDDGVYRLVPRDNSESGAQENGNYESRSMTT